MKKYVKSKIAKVETSDALRERSKEKGVLYVRIAINLGGDESTLNDEQKALFAELSEEEKKRTLNAQIKREISCVKPIDAFADVLKGTDTITAEEIGDDETQDSIISELSDALKGVNPDTKKEYEYLFTIYSFDVSELLQGTDYDGTRVVYDINEEEQTARTIGARNNLYFGFFDDEESAFNFLRGRLIDAIEDNDLSLENPFAGKKPEPKPEPQEKKSRFSRK